MYPLLTTCPVCGGALHVERLGCDECHSTLFVELMVKNRGNINGVAGDLKIAYNTARSRLDDVVAALGYTPPPDDSRPERRAVLDRLASKEISVEEAMKLLRN